MPSPRRPAPLIVRLALALVVACGGGQGGAAPAPTGPVPTMPAVSPTTLPVIAVRARGNRLVDAAGRPLRLRGVHRSGALPDGNRDTPEAWRCWRDGGTCAGIAYEVAGMQELVTAVRDAGAANLILLGGVQYANSLTQWRAHRPADPAGNLAASWHVHNSNACRTRACWDAHAAPVAREVPLVLGELGDDRSESTFITELMEWMDALDGSYLAWVWNVWGSPLDLVTSYDGTPSAYGRTFRTRLAP